jgi:hypothetical protein
MPAATYDILVEQGATYRMSLIYGRKTGALDSDGNEIITPYDLTGAVARLQVRQRRGSEVLISATSINGGITIDVPTGKLVVSFSKAATNNLTMSRARYDLEVEYPSGDVVRIVQGAVKISGNITQDADLDNISPGSGTPLEVDEEDVPGPI